MFSEHISILYSSLELIIWLTLFPSTSCSSLTPYLHTIHCYNDHQHANTAFYCTFPNGSTPTSPVYLTSINLQQSFLSNDILNTTSINSSLIRATPSRLRHLKPHLRLPLIPPRNRIPSYPTSRRGRHNPWYREAIMYHHRMHHNRSTAGACCIVW